MLTKEDKIALIVALSVGAVVTFVVMYAEHRFKKALKARSKEWADRHMQLGWEAIQTRKFFRDATPEERISYFDAYWGTTGGIKK
jgi:hypothetical protein